MAWSGQHWLSASYKGYEDSVIMLLEAGADQLITDKVSKNIIFISFHFVFLFYYFLLIIFTIFYLYSIDRYGKVILFIYYIFWREI